MWSITGDLRVADRGRMTLPGSWPFQPKRKPVFYGWIIWLVSTLGFLMSVPGQTMGMAVFTDPFIEAFGLTRTQLSVAYFIGTVASALFLTRAGRLYDRVGARTMVVGASVLLALMLAFISSIDLLAHGAASLVGFSLGVMAFPLVTMGYFGVRFAGQGVLTSASRNVLMPWFERRRGLVSGVRGVFVSLGFSLAPLPLSMLISAYGWRVALWILLAALVVFAIVALLLLRDDPQSCGLEPDGDDAPVDPDGLHVTGSRGPAATLAEARRSPVFWVYSLGMSVWALFGTAVTYHIVSIFAEAGRDADAAFGYFFPNSLVAVTVNLSASWLADRSPLKPFLLAMISAFLVGTWGLMNLENDWGYWLMVFGFGSGGGLWGMLSNLAFVRHFGLLHLGEISGLNTSVTVFASAIGPVLFSLGKDFSGTYDAAALICVGGLILLLIAAAIVRGDQR
jgi:MFS family permease